MTGQERLQQVFKSLNGRAALMPYMMAGYPDHDASLSVGRAYIESGADIIEIGIPYSDPLADGPVIQAAGQQALEAGSTVADAVDVAAALAKDVAVVVMCYANVVHAQGAVEFVGKLADAGVAGLIIPDQPVDESEDVLGICDSAGIALIPLIAPTTTEERLAVIAPLARGFVYAVSVTGVTGERRMVSEGTKQLVERAKAKCQLPVCVGFGISDAAQAGEVAAFADGVIIGSRLVREIEDKGVEQGVAAVGSFLTEVGATLRAAKG